MSATNTILVEYLATSRIGEKGQLTIPKAYRDAVGLAAGAPIAMLRVGDGLILMPEHARFSRLCDSIRAALKGVGVTEADLQATLPEARECVFARQYPKLAKKEKTKRGAKKS
jgi:AbrB family looped-hinge helix DNA binding protein